MSLVVLSWCPDPSIVAPCADTPCRPPPVTGVATITAQSRAMGWNECLAGDPYPVYYPGSASGPASWSFQGDPPFVNPDPNSGGVWPKIPATTDPAVKYGITTGSLIQPVPITVDGVTVGNFAGEASGRIYPGIDSIFPNPICPNGGLVQLSITTYRPVVDPNYPLSWFYVIETVNYKQYHVSLTFLGGTYQLDPRYFSLYQQYGQTDPILLPGGPRFPINL